MVLIEVGHDAAAMPAGRRLGLYHFGLKVGDSDDELREAMKDSGIGTPATRAAIIERLIDVAYVEREGRALVCTEKGLNVIRLLDGSAGLLERLGADGVNLLNSNGRPAWQTVFHFHMHVIPRYEGDPLRLPWIPGAGDMEDINAAAAQLTG